MFRRLPSLTLRARLLLLGGGAVVSLVLVAATSAYVMTGIRTKAHTSSSAQAQAIVLSLRGVDSKRRPEQHVRGRGGASRSEAAQAGRGHAAIVEQARETFERIGASVLEMHSRIREIVRTTDEVTQVTEMSSAATEQVSAASQETSASTQEIAASAQSLAQTADDVDRLVARFRLA